MKISTKKLAYTAMFTAVSILFNIFTFDTGTKYFIITFTYIPALFASLCLGPIPGFLVAFLGDLIGGFIRPLGPYMPLIGLASGLLGVIPYFAFKFVKGHQNFKIFINFLSCLFICTIFLNTYSLYIHYSEGQTFWAFLIVRLPFQMIVATINFVISCFLYKPIMKEFNKHQKE